MKNVNNFQIAKVQPQGGVSICLIFCQFFAGVVYKSVACKKKSVDRKMMAASFNKFYGKMWDGFCLNTRKRFLIELLF